MGALTGLVKLQLSDAAVFLVALLHICGGQFLISATIVMMILGQTASCDFWQDLIRPLVEWFMTKLCRYCLFRELQRTRLLRKWVTVGFSRHSGRMCLLLPCDLQIAIWGI